MNKAFVEFVYRLENLSGDKNLCEAILQGYLACHPIMEDAAGMASHKTRKFIRQKIGDNMADMIAIDDNREPIRTEKGDKQTVLNYLERQIRDVFFHNEYANIKFEPGVARIAFDDLDFHGENHDNRGIEILKGILKILCSAHADEYDSNLNGLSFDELKERFGEGVARESEEAYKKVNDAEYTKNDSYKIVEIHSFNEAEEYYKYTTPLSRWCLTHMENMWDTYTGNGRNRVYFVLKDGFEDMKPEKGENCPLDDYGLSMICVIVTNDIGDEDRPTLCTCTCRWNHDKGGSDHVMNVEQISNVIGQSFYDTFKPFSVEELHAKGIYTFREKLEKYNETHDRSLFDYVDIFREGYAAVELDGKYNFIDKDGNLLWKSEKWFDYVDDFHEGYARVRLNGKWNLIDYDGNPLWKGAYWFDGMSDFEEEGYAKVDLNGKLNFIDKDGNLIWKGEKWFDDVDIFYEGYAKVELNGKCNLIDKDGNLIWKGKEWFDVIGHFYEGYAKVKLNEKGYNFIDKEGNILSKQWFDGAHYFDRGYAEVVLNGKLNYIDKEGNIVNVVHNFDKGYTLVKRPGKGCNLINNDGKLISDRWFDDIYHFKEGYAVVKLGDNKYNYINTEGKLLSNRSYLSAKDFKDGYGEVYIGGKDKFIDKKGKLHDDVPV